jgi:hypothetical protein
MRGDRVVFAVAAVAVAAGVVTGWICGGRVAIARSQRVRLKLLLLVSLVLGGASAAPERWVSRDASPWLAVAAVVVAAVWALANARRRHRVMRIGALALAMGLLLAASVLAADAGSAWLRDVVPAAYSSELLLAAQIVAGIGLATALAGAMRRPRGFGSTTRPFRRTKAEVFVKGA